MVIKNYEIGARLDRLPVSKWHRKLLWLIGLGLIIDGFDNYIGGVILAQLTKIGWSNDYYNAAFSSATLAGLFVGSLLAGFLGDKFGRKTTYQINLLIFGIGSIIAAFSVNMVMLIGIRAIIGVGLGAEIVVGFSTFTEFLPSKTRGKWVSMLSLIGNSAPPVATLIGLIVIPAFGPTYGWRAMFLIAGIAAFVVWFLRKAMPESPRWLATKGRTDEAHKIVTDVEHEIEAEMRFSLPPVDDVYQEEEEQVKNPFSTLFKKPLLLRTIVGISVLIGMNISLYTITTWIPTLFVKRGISVTTSIFMTTLILFGAPVGVFIATKVIDKFPRKWFGTIMLVLVAIFSVIYAIQTNPITIVIFGFALISFLYIYVCFASAVYVPELWPTEIRLRGAGFCTAIGRGFAILTPYGVAFLLSKFGEISVFLTIAVIMLVVAVILASLGIESRNKSAEEIAYDALSKKDAKELFANKVNANTPEI